jgi:hypothetical protein
MTAAAVAAGAAALPVCLLPLVATALDGPVTLP